jgi:predicted nucleic acid-binding protein
VKVVDASVVLAWLLRDPVPHASQQILGDHVSGRDPAVAPELLWYEVANVLARGADLGAAAASEGYARFESLEVESYGLGPAEYQQALQLALRHRLTVYDASYLALAQALGVRFVTADRKLARKVAGLGIVDLVS